MLKHQLTLWKGLKEMRNAEIEANKMQKQFYFRHRIVAVCGSYAKEEKRNT